MNDYLQEQNLEPYDATAEMGETKQRSVLIGLLVALVFAMIGTIPWIIVGVFGYFASFCGAIISIAAAKGYFWYTEKRTLFGGIGLVVICLLAFAFAIYATEVIVVYQELKEEGYSLILLFLRLHILIFSDTEYLNHFLGNVGLGLLFLVLGMRGTFRVFFAK